MNLLLRAALLMIILALACQKGPEFSITKAPFGTMEDGTPVYLYTLTNANGMTVKITNYGGIITHIIVPDKNGVFSDVTLGYDNLDGYLKASPYFGAIIGRYGNRIAKGKFTLNGVEYSLATNNDPNHLHGGVKGFDKVVWDAAPVTAKDHVALVLSYISPDGEEGYPGEMKVKVIYTLTNDNEIKINFHATTDKTTIVNLTNHAYFNLKDGGKTDILGHKLLIRGDWITPVDATLIPTGELADVTNTPFDFRAPIEIGARINEDNEQLKFGLGYDHNWVVNGTPDSLRLAAKAVEPETGRVLEVLSDQPGIQFYSGNFLDGTITGKNGTVYNHRTGFCLECQHYPDSPNKPGFPSVVLEPGQEYSHVIIYRFSTM